MDLFTKSDATFSPCRRYRYTLWRRWGDGPVCMYLMLNPSTADELANDPTVERCERRSREAGFGALVVCNLFAFRATDPDVMKAYEDPVGPGNDAAILETAMSADLVVCAWGNHGTFRDRSRAVTGMLQAQGVSLHRLALNGSGEPKHPLYVSYALQPVPWEPS